MLESAAPEAAHRNLREIAAINRWFGGHRVLRSVFSEIVRPGESFSVLDVGAASGDMGRRLASLYPRARVVSLDRAPLHLERAPEPRVVADALRLPFGAGAFDFVLCSSMLHEIGDAEAAALLPALLAVARRALVVLDLERHWLAESFLPATRWLFGWSPLTLVDGPVSVRAAYTAAELSALARHAGVTAQVCRHRPWFRLSLVAPAEGVILGL